MGSLLAAAEISHPQTGYGRALAPFLHPFHWQREERPDNHMVTHCCHIGDGRPPNYSLEEPPPPRSTQARPLTNSRSLLTCHGGWACCCASISSSSPDESHRDSADIEMSRPAAEALPFTGVLLSNSTFKGWFNSACSLHKLTKLLFCPLAKMNIL